MPVRLRFPDSLVLIAAMIVVAWLSTYLIPAGAFERESAPIAASHPQTVVLPEAAGLSLEDGRVVLTEGPRTVTLPAGTARLEPTRKVVPGSWRPVEAEPLPWHAPLTLLPKGLEAAAEIIFFVFLVGGVIQVLRATGAIDALIGAAIRRAGGSPGALVVGTTLLFALGSATIGMAEEYMPFVPILVAMCLALRMDAVTAMGIVYVGAGVGYGAATLNPFTVLIAKDIAEQDPQIFFWPRWALLALLVAIGSHHILAYGRRVQANPASSLVADVDYSDGFALPADTALTGRRQLVIALFVAMIGLFVYGLIAWDWYLVELAALFLGTGVLAAIAGGLGANETSRAFMHGAADMTSTALLIGFARTIEVVLTEARVIDTVVHFVASALSAGEALGPAAPVATAWGMLLVQSGINFLVPSGSGQAYVTMPIMAPIADLTGVGRETAVLAYQFGDGFTNMIVPTNALLMGMLGLARVPFQRWVRFIVPLLAKIYAVLLAVLAYTALIGL